jgi:hypothetical protein
MSNPWTRGAATVWPLGPNQGTDNFSGLANGQAKCLGVVQPGTLTAPFGDIIIPPWLITLASAPTANANITRYLIPSEDDTNWPGGISPTSTSDQSAALLAWLAYDPAAAQAAMIDQLVMSASVTVYRTRWRGLKGFFTDGNIATYTTVLVYNQSGVAFASYSSGNQVATYATDTYN